mmetsp:Transcript_21362/g.36400  ORF Transcript_21362/g.36400 Transcript_21362/m.36400 type:complete len:418 (+) Transcript_21362:78-1331(+)|eukprot:CAMPEP_0119101990 /NCGR_PEP_ID=MMETSP1180-20130426/876_1 /TAXON_ID=3052 ORGANISM="Chlamydomonas cf sp, Strain CCMP681" /NCGR_SAMPLE_ID=MMETSP1180 /ASSEMBLY_ACC=CAM_ASM_000741 /LENGTH=417 /DNA_ID=CAMNT_0007086195 /DNA_START=81 /DNA_END=1334 /DNA_ORIENTATION=+
MSQGQASIFVNIPVAPGDPILAIGDAFKVDKDPSKINLGVGAYRTEAGTPLVLNVVRKAEALLAVDPSANKEYLAITGDPVFCRLARELALGANSAAIREKRVATVQGLSGTGSLRVGAEFLAAHYPVKTVFIPSPTWPTHRAIFTKAGFKVSEYRYYLPATRGLDLQGLLTDLTAAPQGSVVILHACAHNPTGVDPTPTEWKAILDVVLQRGLLPFFDSAYQGFATGDLDADAAALRLFVAAKRPSGAPLELLLAQSFAKNMGLYGERVGALSVISSDSSVVSRVEGQLRLIIRPMYSNPPRHGAEIAARIMGDPALFAEWKVELKGMADRIKAMRTALYDSLKRRQVPGTWNHVVDQIGMFTFTGLNRAQCEAITARHHVYLTMDGRISMAGLNKAGADRLAGDIKDVLGAPSKM